MGENSGIAWTDHSFNPWWGCEKISPGCKHCYADTFSRRVGHGARLPLLWGPESERRLFGDKHWAEPLKWNRDAERDGVRRRVFCASMADVFEDRPELEAPRERLRLLISKTHGLDWLLLTKRPENADRLWQSASIAVWERGSSIVWERGTNTPGWPSNVWLGTTAENQEMANRRIQHLLAVPATVRFLSCEPLLEPIVLGTFGYQLDPKRFWVICGGESGPNARLFDLRWARALRDQCRDAAVPFFMKQIGAHAVESVTEGTSGMGGIGWPTKDRAGADPSEWPADLRVRGWPRAAVLQSGDPENRSER